MQHSLIAVAGGAGFVRIGTRNDDNFVLYALLNLPKSGDIVQNGVLPVCRTGADDEDQPVIRSGKN